MEPNPPFLTQGVSFSFPPRKRKPRPSVCCPNIAVVPNDILPAVFVAKSAPLAPMLLAVIKDANNKPIINKKLKITTIAPTPAPPPVKVFAKPPPFPALLKVSLKALLVTP